MTRPSNTPEPIQQVHNNTATFPLSQVKFGNEAGDDENENDLIGYFVEQNTFSEFLDANEKIRVITAKKGVGKSALIRWIEFSLKNSLKGCQQSDSTPLVISCKGKDLVRANFNIPNTPKSPNEYINDWTKRICCFIARHIGTEIGIAITDDSVSLVEAAEIGGQKQKNLIGEILDRIRFSIGGNSLEKKPTERNYEEVLKRYGDKNIWLLVDDLDATYQNTKEENLEIGTFLSAMRDIVARIGGIVFRVTMRTDVWPMVKRSDEALDKVQQYVNDITWNEDDFKKLLYKRIMKSLPSASPKNSIKNEEKLINEVFEENMLWGDGERKTYRVLYTLSYNRPRWAVQLCKAAQKDAIKNNSLKIGKKHIDAVWGEYGKQRIADLVSEHKHQAECIEEMIRAFTGAQRLMSKDELIEWIKVKIYSKMSPVVERKKIVVPLDLAQFLYRIGFIVARVTDEKSGDYGHLHFSDHTEFLNTRTLSERGIKWEIHPCYREVLDIEKINQEIRRQKNKKV